MGARQSQHMRVGIVCGYRPTPSGGGTERHVYELTRGLLDRGVQVEIVCEDRPFLPDPDNPLADRIMGINPGSLHSRSPVDRFWEKSKLFAELIDPMRYDIIHCHGQYGHHIALRLAQLSRRPLLASTFHLTARGPIERHRQLGLPEPEEGTEDRAVSFMEQTIGCLSDECIAVSHGVATEMTQLYGVPLERVRVIPNWYDANTFKPADQETARRLLNLDPDRPYLLYVGHFNMSRGKIMAQTLRCLPHDISLIVAHHEADAAIDYEFGARVKFTGHLTPQMLALYYSSADLLCFPSVYGGFGLVLIEAMACGCPAVAFDYAAMNEIVTDDCGYLIATPEPAAYAAAIESALRDGRRKGFAALRRAQAYRMGPQIDEVLNLYRGMLWRLSASSESAS